MGKIHPQKLTPENLVLKLLYKICYTLLMTNQTIKQYIKLRPKKAKIIKKAVTKGIREYEETFKRLAAV